MIEWFSIINDNNRLMPPVSSRKGNFKKRVSLKKVNVFVNMTPKLPYEREELEWSCMKISE